MVTIRSYKQGDFAQVKGLLTTCGTFLELLDTEDAYEEKAKKDPESIIIAEDKGKIVGLTVLTIDPWATFGWHLAVHPDYQGKGVAVRIMLAAREVLRKRGVKRISGLVMKSNVEVRKLYRFIGFEEYAPDGEPREYLLVSRDVNAPSPFD